MEDKKPPRSVKTANTVFAIIETLDENGEMGVTELANCLDMAPSSIHKHLMTLYSNGYLIKDGSQYSLGLKIFSIGMDVKRRDDIIKFVKPFLKQVADESGELVWFVKEEHGYGIYLEKAEGEYAVQPYTQVGNREYLHNIAAGKAILAFLPEDRVREICDLRGLKKFTDNTITDIEDLFEELEEIRDRGYAFNKGETIENHRAVASPISYKNQVLGSIVLSGPKKRMTGKRFEQELPELVSGTTNAIELEIQKEFAQDSI